MKYQDPLKEQLARRKLMIPTSMTLIRVMGRKRKSQRSSKTAGGVCELCSIRRAMWPTPNRCCRPETWKIRSTVFKRFFRMACWRNGIPLKTEELRETINLLEARAQFDGPEIEVYAKVAALHGEIWIDLCDRNWAAVKVTPDAWNVVALPDVRFNREPGMDALPEPELGGTVQALRRFLNVCTEEDFLLVIAFVLGALSGRGPFPVLVLIGEQGTAK